MGLTDFLKKTSGMFKARAATAIGALRAAAAKITVSVPTRIVGGVKIAARGARLTTPAGIALTAVGFAPQIVRGVKAAIPFLRTAAAKAAGFLGGKTAGAAIAGGGAGAIVGIVTGGKPGEPVRPSAPGEDGIIKKVAGAIAPFAVPRAIIKKIRKKKKPKAARRRKRKAPKPRRGGAHKAAKPGLDIAHKRGKKGISLKTIRASIASPRTPPQLKKGLRRLLRQKRAHSHKR